MPQRNIEKIIADIDGRVEELRSEQIDFLRDICNIDSGSCDVEGNKKVVDKVLAVLKGFGAEVTEIFNPAYGTHLIARIGKKDAAHRIVLHAHMDTVFQKGDAETHPFRIEGEYAWGLGSADCKGGVTTALYSARIVSELGLIPEDTEIVLLFNCDEELGSPSASTEAFPQAMTGAEACISFEPGRKKNGLLTARYGCCFVTVKIHGKSVHAGMDNGPGASAVVELANLVQYLDSIAEPDLGIHYNAAPIRGGIRGTIVADYAEFDIFATYATAAANEKVMETLKDLPNKGVVDGCSIEVCFGEIFPAMERKPESVKLFEKIQAAAKLIDVELPEEYSKAAGDCNMLASFGVPTVDGAGPYLFNIHTLDEHIILHTLGDRTKLMSLFLATY